ncbi:MAG: 2-amino-4-hydroxy-6-hydroxymethyldihydropteridine diphosphokinase [Xanthomonadales bacterium]|jgi:2-amino-4-hydroxy-6-hydroxymethyldihydropteridine diphosphokinase|nr:2-amino-4-hydroxy-6-hydroxymethyldihydropteridine diphosphokinase [Xanthomonadales bacterium]
MKAWIGLGGNREDSAALIAEALMRIEATPGVSVRRRSRCYRSPPWGLADQPDFVNAVAELETVLEPLPLLHLLLAVESRLGRRRDGTRWGPRCIDLDLLTYEGLRLRSSELVLPHPEMQLRAFVLVPLLELEPGFMIPGVGPVVDCLADIDASEAAAVVPLPSTRKESRS